MGCWLRSLTISIVSISATSRVSPSPNIISDSPTFPVPCCPIVCSAPTPILVALGWAATFAPRKVASYRLAVMFASYDFTVAARSEEKLFTTTTKAFVKPVMITSIRTTCKVLNST